MQRDSVFEFRNERNAVEIARIAKAGNHASTASGCLSVNAAMLVAATGSASLIDRSSRSHNMGKPTKSRPPNKLPSVTGSWFHSHQSASDTGAPIHMPAGITNIL